MLHTCYEHGLTKGTIIQIFYHGLDSPTQGILDAGGIFLYNTPNEAFKILNDKVLLKLDFSDDSQNNPKQKTIVSIGGSNINFDHAILMEKFEALATKIDSDFLKIRKELKEILRNRHAIIENLERQFKYLEKTQQTKSLPRTTNTKPKHEFFYKPPSIRNENDKGDVKVIEEDETKPIPTMPNPSLIISNSSTVSPFIKECTVHSPYTNAKTFADDVLSNHVGDEALHSIDGVGTGQIIKKNENGMPKLVRMTMHEVVHEMVVGEYYEPNSEGSGSAWKAYMNARVVGLFLLVLLEYPNNKGVVCATSRDSIWHYTGQELGTLL
ncbi:hypothetical protein Tco_0593320 [Tanacetum coccineum]